jgi:uncharacterized protein (DUF2225 family)
VTRIVGVDLPCPCCGQTVHITQVQSISYQGRDSDFRPVGVRDRVVALMLNTCGTCGFSGLEEDFEQPLPPGVAAKVRDRVTAQAAAVKAGSVVHWQSAAMIAAWRGAPAFNVGESYLRGAWAIREYHPRRAERFWRWEEMFLYMAAEYFASVVYAKGSGPRTRSAYLVGEIWRRTGETWAAHLWFDRAIELAAANPKLAWLGELALRQKTAPSDTL